MFCVITNKAFLQTQGHHGYANQSFIIFYVTMCFFSFRTGVTIYENAVFISAVSIIKDR